MAFAKITLSVIFYCP